ncbi:pyridoxal kinase [Kiloniella laminariae]|uniref:pyridoxal kinase n=1 Tax=Kiloniella laminariae TaxID=454162 RepID=A0ABT4LLF2_9PROT|nr:pyridoxal kinase [Kiloniella laminariae]MCZ4281916.1 pyridoxal kinase [Kiloniella laminariae]
MPSLISVQSQVCFGHVGNSAATFPLQLLGIDVHAVPTTLLSNHPAHPSVYGREIEAELLEDLLKGLSERGAFARSSGLLSGYLTSVANGDVLVRALKDYKKQNPKGVYILDPVMGDQGSGLFVREGIPDLIADQLLPLADIITPNKFEFEILVGAKAAGYPEMISLARSLMIAQSINCVVITSANASVEEGRNTESGQQGRTAVLVIKKNSAWLLETPLFDQHFSGTGDLFASILVGWVLKGDAVEVAAQRAVTAVYAILKQTTASGSAELNLITNYKCIFKSGDLFTLKIV